MDGLKKSGNVIDVTPIVAPGVNSLEVAKKYADEWEKRMSPETTEAKQGAYDACNTQKNVGQLLDVDPAKVVYGGLIAATTVVGIGAVYKVGELLF